MFAWRGFVPTVKNDTGNELDSECNTEEISGYAGLVLESMGGGRNKKYNQAFEIILQRLINFGVPFIQVFVISSNLTKFYPDIEDRALSVNGDRNIKLGIMSAKETRLAIGREQKDLKENQQLVGGNSTKRILIHNENISSDLWCDISQGTISNKDFISLISEPTGNHAVLERKVSTLLKTEISKPVGYDEPNKITQQVQVYERDPKVKAWVLKQSNGICEVCDSPAPFTKSDGEPYLEVHHVLPLAEGGSDTVSNTVAICPNCHMMLHYSFETIKLRMVVVNKVARLISEKQLTRSLDRENGVVTC